MASGLQIDHDSPMYQFDIGRIADWQIGGLDASFSKSAVFMIAAVLVATLFLTLSTRRRAMVPDRWQGLAELWYEFIANMVRETIGNEGRKYFPLVFTLFSFIVLCNLLGMLPYSFTVTSHIAVTGALALLVFAITTVIGFARHGLHFLSFFVPKGVPAPMLLLVVPVEVLSYFMRPISHSVRLFANMTAGHTMLKVFGKFIVDMLAANALLAVASILPFVLIVALTGLEILIAFLQAYVFAILTCLYLNDAIHLEH